MERGTLCGKKPPSSAPPPPPPPPPPVAPPAACTPAGCARSPPAPAPPPPIPPAPPAPRPPAPPPGVAPSPLDGEDVVPVVAVPPTRFFTFWRMLFILQVQISWPPAADRLPTESCRQPPSGVRPSVGQSLSMASAAPPMARDRCTELRVVVMTVIHLRLDGIITAASKRAWEFIRPVPPRTFLRPRRRPFSPAEVRAFRLTHLGQPRSKSCRSRAALSTARAPAGKRSGCVWRMDR